MSALNDANSTAHFAVFGSPYFSTEPDPTQALQNYDERGKDMKQ